MSWTAENILGACFGEEDNKIEVEFNKTILIRNYETEKYTAHAEIRLDKSVDGYDRTLITCILTAQLELQMFASLMFRNKVTQEEYNNRKNELLQDVNAAASRYEALTGRDSKVYFSLMEERT